MTQHRTGTREEWRHARVKLLELEKEHTRRSDELARIRRDLPWVRIDKPYAFDADEGTKTLAELFGGRPQLLVYHIMFAPDRSAGCVGCSMVADHFDGGMVHLNQHDVTMACVSRAALERINAYKRRMGWRFPWVSSARNDFNFDFGVSYTEDQQTNGAEYNFRWETRPRGGGPRAQLIRARGRGRLPRLLDLRPRDRHLQHLLPAARPRPKGPRRGEPARRALVVAAPRRVPGRPGVTVTDRIIETDGVKLCTEPFGDPADPPILLITGTGASMLWWEEGFCRMLAGGRRYVIRYDHRDSGRSITYQPGRPGYTGADLVADAAGVLDAHQIPAAHIVGASAGGAMAQLLALDHPDRVRSLVLISTSPALPTGRRLPPPTHEFTRFVSTAQIDWSDADSVIDYLVDYSRILAGEQRRFNEAAARHLVRRDVARARDIAAIQNHDLLTDNDRPRKPLSATAVPTLIVHGTADPMFPIAHGQALTEDIPGARMLPLEGAGHGVDRVDWETITNAILEHTAGTRQ